MEAHQMFSLSKVLLLAAYCIEINSGKVTQNEIEAFEVVGAAEERGVFDFSVEMKPNMFQKLINVSSKCTQEYSCYYCYHLYILTNKRHFSFRKIYPYILLHRESIANQLSLYLKMYQYFKITLT
jgi:hypothetical protein